MSLDKLRIFTDQPVSDGFLEEVNIEIFTNSDGGEGSMTLSPAPAPSGSNPGPVLSGYWNSTRPMAGTPSS